MTLDLSVIIVSHGHDAFLPGCLESLGAALQGLAAEVILVDNLGRSDTDAFAARCPVPMRTISNQHPLGLAANSNQAANQSRARWLLLLNPDTAFRSGRLTEAIGFMERRPEFGVLGCRLVNPDASLQSSYRRFPILPAVLARCVGADNWRRRPRFYRSYLMEGHTFDEASDVDWVFGAFMLVRRDAFEAVGRMDERFFLYYEDVDLCYRLRKKGLRTVYFPDIEVMHHYHRSSANQLLGGVWWRHVQSMFWYFLKHRCVLRVDSKGQSP